MQPLFSRFLRISFLATAIAFSLSSFALNDIATAKLKPSEIQSKTAIEIVNQLNQHHYRKQEFNDSLSSRFLDEYLQTLDASKNFFIATDIAEFDKYRKTFDDDFKTGQLNNGFNIYYRFGERFTARLTKVIAMLDDKNLAFTFDADETFKADRKKRKLATHT